MLALGLIFCSCSKKVTPSISLANNSASFTCNGGTVKVPVSSNCSWVADCEAEDVMIAPASYNGDCNVSVTVPPTQSETTESVRITFTASSGESTATAKFVATVQARPFIKIPQSASTVTVPSTDCGVKINIECNDEWEYVYSSANKTLTVSPQSGFGSQEVSVSFPASTVTRDKQFNLTFRLKNDTSKSVVIKFKQMKKGSTL